MLTNMADTRKKLCFYSIKIQTIIVIITGSKVICFFCFTNILF